MVRTGVRYEVSGQSGPWERDAIRRAVFDRPTDGNTGKVAEPGSTMMRSDSVSLVATPMSRRTVGMASIAAGLALAGLGRVARPAAAQDITIRYQHWGSLAEKDAMTAVCKAYQEANPTIKIDQQHIADVDDAYNTRLNTQVAAGELPDVFQINEARAMEWSEQGIVLDLSPYADQYAGVIPQAKFFSAPGKLVGPMTGVETTLIFANREIFEQDGVALPPVTAETAWTWDQFVETAKALTKDRSGKTALDADFDSDSIQQYGVTFPTWWLGWYPLVRSAGADLTDPEGLTYTLNSPEAADVFQKLQDLIFVHHVAPTPTAAEGLPASAQQLQTRRVAMTIDGQWNLLDMNTAEVPLAIGVLPNLGTPTTVIVGATTVINAETPIVNEALAFHTFLNKTDQILQLMTSGVWMPNETAYYTDEALIASWVDNEGHPPEYRTAAVDYVLNNSVPGPITIKGFPAIQSRLNAALDQVWDGSRPAIDVLNEVQAEIQPMLSGRYPGE
jgi:multiple sugar transport system substrate-binding protein